MDIFSNYIYTGPVNIHCHSIAQTDLGLFLYKLISGLKFLKCLKIVFIWSDEFTY